MLKGFAMLQGIDPVGLGFIIVIVLGIVVFLWFKRGFARAKVKENLEILEATQNYEKVKQEKAKKEGKERKGSILGTGKFNCMCFRPGQILDWTTIPTPIGELYQADTSCPTPGGIYIVREMEDGEIVDYDPREITVDIKKTPEWAWSATHCDWIVRRFWSVPISVWKSPATWFAAAMILVLFISTMALLGG